MKIDVFASGSKGNCYKISDGETNLLLEAGITLKEIRIATDFNLHEIEGCLITHEHGDHSKAGTDLAKAGINIYASQGTLSHMEWQGHHYKPLIHGQKISIGSFVVLPFDIKHDAKEPLGFLIESITTREKLLYVTDTFYIKYNFSKTKLDYAMVECNYCESELQKAVEKGRTDIDMAKRLRHTHMSLETLLNFFKANDTANLKQIYLLHLSDRNANEQEMKIKIQQETGAEVYLC